MPPPRQRESATVPQHSRSRYAEHDPTADLLRFGIRPRFQTATPVGHYVEMTVALASIQLLMKENEAELLRERRSADRKPFVRPVVIATGRGRETLHDAFSRDISLIGIGLVSRIEWQIGTPATLTIHSLGKHVVKVMAEVRWCQPYGEKWYLSGWRFVSEAS